MMVGSPVRQMYTQWQLQFLKSFSAWPGDGHLKTEPAAFAAAMQAVSTVWSARCE